MVLEKIQKVKKLLAGIDIGSTTTKIVAVAPESGEIVYSDYKRHNAAQVQSVKNALERLALHFPTAKIRLCLTGSGAKLLAERLKIPFVQEVVANSIALRQQYDEVGTAIELGGQDAKIIFFKKDETTGQSVVSDMRMNGSCAGGTGAFIDEVASILKTPIEEFDARASRGKCVYDISGRCGVYAKTDIQPLLNQGVSRADLALSAFHAIAKQTIGGLAQGLDIEKPVAFEGGPLTFNPTLVEVFKERLQLSEEDVIIPERPEIMIAYGAAISLNSISKQEELTVELTVEELLQRIACAEAEMKLEKNGEYEAAPFFSSPEEKQEFLERHRLPEHRWKQPEKGEVVRAYLGIDSGSTTTKFVLMDEKEQILDSFYSPNQGKPLKVAKEALIAMRDRYREAGAQLEILAVGTTGYGELLFANAFDTECHVVETVAHARAASKYMEDVSFILDIGGQDMKAIWIDNGIITNIVVNEACSSGCGSFLENFASSLNIEVKEIANAAFSSQNPAVLGSRCTVFMNSSVITEQRNGKLPEDIMAGLCRSIIENVFTKVIRISNLDSLGDKIVVQGGTFENDAVLCAMEQYTGRKVIRAPYPGIMGAIGAALITKERHQENCQKGDAKKTFIGLDAMDDFAYTQEANSPCPFCANHCKRTIVTFSNGKTWITNNRCERGEVLGNPKDEDSGKVPLVLKLDESDIQGPLGIRVRSFVETVSMRRKQEQEQEVQKLTDPYPVKFTKASRKEKVVLVPNTSHAFSRVMSAALSGQGVRAVPLAIGREEAIRLGKQYVHNDICFPAQIVIGEALAALKSGEYDDKEVAIGMGKYVGDCRLTHYSALLRKALDDAGYAHVPILTNDDVDYHDMHPGFKMNMISAMRIAFALPMIDVLEELLRKIRPYELEKGSTDAAFEHAMDELIDGLQNHGIPGAKKGFAKAIDIMNQVPYDRSNPKPTVLIVGEYLLNFHPGANHDIEAYLEQNGFEIIEARMTDVIRKTYFYQDSQIQEYHLKKPVNQKVWYRVANMAFNVAHDITDSIAKKHPLYEKTCRMQDLVKESDPIIHHTFDAGEGVLIPGEVLHHAKHGCRAFVILQPFGCLPNHVVGRGIAKRLKEYYPDVQILPLDYDPDVSFANIENRLQMLIMNAKEQEK